MTNEKAMAIIDECRERLTEIGVEDVLIAVGAGNGTAFSFRGASKSLAYLSMAAWMEIMLNSMANNPIDTGFGFTLEGNE
ncbi:MAG: hypothetical protein CMB45_03025 [Euryarchaeota archaeon]|nr:hypothetical protein [Euryarchaeota archaeon]|tara:strand:+ start:1638 stop:1877 length:240 start_codon:yes stop_codon:yes gene_type:complete